MGKDWAQLGQEIVIAVLLGITPILMKFVNGEFNQK